MRNLVVIGFRNIRRGSYRALLVALIFTLCSFSLIWILSVQESVLKESTNHFIRKNGHFYIETKGELLLYCSLIKAVYSEIAQENIAIIVPFIRIQDAEIGADGKYNITDIYSLAEEEKNKTIRLKKGRSFAPQGEEKEIVLNEELVESIDAEINDYVSVCTLTADGIMNVIYYKLVGISPFYEKNYLSYRGAQILINDMEKVSGIKIWLNKKREICKKIKANLMKELKQKVIIKDWQDFLKSTTVKNLNNLMFALTTLFTFIVFITAGAIIANFTWLTVQDRVREIGTYMAIGCSRIKLITLIVSESFMLALLSSIIGVILGVILCLIVRELDIYIVFGHFLQAHLLPVVTLKNIVISVSFCALLGGMWSLLPAIKITAMEPVEALRHV